MLEQDPGLVEGNLLSTAQQGGNVACVRLLHERGSEFGCIWVAMCSKNAECLSYTLDHYQEDPGEMLRHALMYSASSCCLQELYDKGCLPRSRDVWSMLEPFARRVKLCSRFEYLKILVENSGRPRPTVLCTAEAASSGVDCLRYVRELGAAWSPGTLRAASSSVDTLRYARENGCPWGEARMSDFVDSFACLCYAHEHHCPYDEAPHKRWIRLTDFVMLQFICESMDPTWAKGVVANSVNHYALQKVDDLGDTFWRWRFDSVLRCECLVPRKPDVDWRVPLYLVKKLKVGRERMGWLAKLADVCLDGTAALAQCFYAAGKGEGERRAGFTGRDLAAMGRCPPDVCEKIAMMADLVLPWGQHDSKEC
jgi:hypothetical protein